MSPATTRQPAAFEIWVLSIPAELVESDRLRYQVYSALGHLQRLNRPKLDIDEYDSSSIPFGAFDPSSGELIATLRLVKAHPQLAYDDPVRTIVASCGDVDLARQAWAPQPQPPPSIELLRSLREGAGEHTLEHGRGSRVVYRFATPRRGRRRTTSSDHG